MEAPSGERLKLLHRPRVWLTYRCRIVIDSLVFKIERVPAHVIHARPIVIRGLTEK
jgi:hypothetical protein